ncbi:MAG TPA: hypothetical protein DGG95_02535 [Cytophagales bacterium]|nr:hypothetical protein [Cytophagales bacterium]
MELLKEKLKTLHFKPEQKSQEEWRVLGSELTAHFGKNCYWLLWRYPKHNIYEKFKIAKKEERSYLRKTL